MKGALQGCKDDATTDRECLASADEAASGGEESADREEANRSAVTGRREPGVGLTGALGS